MKLPKCILDELCATSLRLISIDHRGLDFSDPNQVCVSIQNRPKRSDLVIYGRIGLSAPNVLQPFVCDQSFVPVQNLPNYSVLY